MKMLTRRGIAMVIDGTIFVVALSFIIDAINLVDKSYMQAFVNRLVFMNGFWIYLLFSQLWAGTTIGKAFLKLK